MNEQVNMSATVHPDRNILTEYSFPIKPPFKAFHVQKQTARMLTEHQRGYVLNGIGTGKTLCSLWAYDYLRTLGVVNKLLIIAPLSTLMRTWAKEIITNLPHLRYKILHGAKVRRLTQLEANVDVYIINHHGLNIISNELLVRPDIDIICVDELSVFRNGQSKTLTIPLKKYIKHKVWAWGLTGSPCPRAVTDVWGQASCITPWSIPPYFSHLRSELMIQRGPFGWDAKPGAVEKAIKCLSPSVRYKLSDVTEIPDQQLLYYEAELTNQQKDAYEQMSRTAVAMVRDNVIDAMNAGAVLSKLLQIALGYVYKRDGTIVQLDNTPRLQMTVDLIDACAEKVILFAPFKSAINGLHRILESNNIKHFLIHGDVSPKQRVEIYNVFQDNPNDDRKVLIAHPGTMSHGLTLTAATTTIWLGPITNLELFFQANGRTKRIGQNHKTLVAMVGGTARERRLYKLLGNNERIQNRFLELIEMETELKYK